MQYSKLLEIVWLIASRETIAASWKEIQPSHFLMGILKLSEISLSEILAQQNIDKNLIQEISGELDKIQQFFKKENINATLLRREIRSKLGNGNEIYTGGVIHRSESCKQLFVKTEQYSNKEGKNAIDLLDLFIVFAEEIKPDLFKKKNETLLPEELNQLTVPFDMRSKYHITYQFPAAQHPVRISLTRRLTQLSKGVLLFYEESKYLYLHLSVVADTLREQAHINLNVLKTDKILSEYEFLELLELYTHLDNAFLIFPAIENDHEILFPIQALNRFLNKTNIPSKILLAVSSELQQWWYAQCPKSKLFLSPLVCIDEPILSVDKV